MSGFSLDELREVLDAERRRMDLVELPGNFFRDAADYMSRLIFEAQNSSGIREEILRAELAGVSRALEELYLLRRSKVLRMLSRGVKPQFSEDEEGYEEIDRVLKRMEIELLHSAAIRPRVAHPSGPVRSVCLFLIDIPERIICEDRKAYGPFVRGDIANIPKKNAEILSRHGAVAILIEDRP
ncbi:MAG: hypothetical protein QXG10_02465 [Candidatus Hadarchaeales archaeon]